METILDKMQIDLDGLFRTIKHPLVILDKDDNIVASNDDAEFFFGLSRNILNKYKFTALYSTTSPLYYLINQSREKKTTIREYSLMLTNIIDKKEHEVDIQVSPFEDTDYLLLMFIERGIAKKFNRQYMQAGSAKSLVEMSSILAHEIKNPLSGIKGAAQLLLDGASHENQSLISIICDETDRINNLINSMQIFSDSSQIKKEKINMHTIFNHVKMIAENGFAKDIKFIERFDPSLPHVHGNKDLLIQVLMNLIKNSSEAIKNNSNKGEIILSSSFLSSVRISLPTSSKKIELPLCFSIEDNGGGIDKDIYENIFDPFITSKKDGKGLGLSIVSKIIQDHDGVIECGITSKGTKMSILFPVSQ